MAPDDPTVLTLHVDANRWFAVCAEPPAVVLCTRVGDEVHTEMLEGEAFTAALVELLAPCGPPDERLDLHSGPAGIGIRITVSPLTAKWLCAAAKASWAIADDTDVPMARVLELLTNHAADGARRRGAWERGWLNQVLGLEGDPVELVDCEHDWQGRGLRQCANCLAYRPDGGK